MTTLREAAQQALEQLKINRTNFRKGPSKSICKMLAGGNDEAIESLEAALAEQATCKESLQVEQEPVQEYERGFVDGMMKQTQSSVDRAVNSMCRKPLSEAEILKIWVSYRAAIPRWLCFAQAIEAAHGIGSKT